MKKTKENEEPKQPKPKDEAKTSQGPGKTHNSQRHSTENGKEAEEEAAGEARRRAKAQIGSCGFNPNRQCERSISISCSTHPTGMRSRA